MQFNNVVEHYLSQRKISSEIQNEFNVHALENKIVFPVYDEQGNFLFNKYRRSPLTNDGPKYTYDKGSKISLYGINKAKDFDTILITEGEADCLVAWSHNIPAVTSTGGAQSFQDEWKDYFKDKEVIICYDNDYAGAEGMVKTLEIIPHAKVLFVPLLPNVKDISDYVVAGGNLHDLIKTAKSFNDISEVSNDRVDRVALMQPVDFHDAYIKKHTKINTYTERKSFSSDKVTNAKQYPIPNLMKFDNNNKARCPFHNEKTASFVYYPDTNSCYCFGCSKVADSIEIYRHQNNCSFAEAVKELNKLK
jgi:DNA primase